MTIGGSASKYRTFWLVDKHIPSNYEIIIIQLNTSDLCDGQTVYSHKFVNCNFWLVGVRMLSLMWWTHWLWCRLCKFHFQIVALMTFLTFGWLFPYSRANARSRFSWSLVLSYLQVVTFCVGLKICISCFIKRFNLIMLKYKFPVTGRNDLGND